MSLLISKTFDSIPPFKHTPLDHMQPSIRIIKVLPDLSPEGFVQCTLTHNSTADDYTCLSYTWGDEGTVCPILVGAHLFFVRQNLHDFLHVVRRLYPLRPFWIDAVCIDQDTVAERNHQVAQMGAIYTAAAHVLVWLGSSSNIAEFFRAFNKVPRYGNRWRPYWMSAQDGRKGVRAGWNEFGNHAYWTRAWITQEIVHSKTISLLADAVEVHDPWSITLSPWAGAPRCDMRCYTHMSIALRHYEVPIIGDSLLSLLKTFPDQVCGNPRDRIYSLLGLAAEGAAMRVNYGSSDVEFVTMLSKTFKRLQCLCGLTYISDMLRGMETLNAEVSKEVTFFRVTVPANSAYILSKSMSKRQQPDCWLLSRRDEVCRIRLVDSCPADVGNCSLEVTNCEKNGKSRYIGRFTRLSEPGYGMYCGGHSCSRADCPCQDELWWPGWDSHSKTGVYYDCGVGIWRPSVAAAQQKAVIWYRQPGSTKMVSNWFLVELQPKVLDGRGLFIVDVPVEVLWSYTQQSKAFQGLEALFFESKQIVVAPYYSKYLNTCHRFHEDIHLIMTAMEHITSKDVWLHED